MKEKRKPAKKPAGAAPKAARPVGFWSRTEPVPAAVSVRLSSRLARSLAFLRRIVGWNRKHDER